MPRKSSYFTLMLIGVVAVGILMLAIGIVIWQRQAAETNQRKQEYARKNTERQQLKAETTPERIRDKEAERSAIRAKLSVLDRDMLDYRYMPTYLAQIQRTARETGNEIQTIQPRDLKPLDLVHSPFAGSTPTARKSAATAPGSTVTVTSEPSSASTANTVRKGSKQYYLQPIDLTIRGSYVSLLAFLDRLRMFPKVVYVRTLSVTPSGKENGEQLSTRIETYAIIIPSQYLSEKVASGKVQVQATSDEERGPGHE